MVACIRRTVLALGVAALAVAGPAQAACNTGGVCSGPLQKMTISAGVLTVVMTSTGSQAISVCNGFFDSTAVVFRLNQDLPRYEEAFTLLHAGTITGRSFTVFLQAEAGTGNCKAVQVGQD